MRVWLPASNATGLLLAALFGVVAWLAGDRRTDPCCADAAVLRSLTDLEAHLEVGNPPTLGPANTGERSGK